MPLSRRLLIAVALIVLAGLVIAIFKGGDPVAQVTINGLVTGGYFALGAIGLSFVYGILRLLNFAQGDLLTLGAYMTLLLNVSAHVALIPSVLFGTAMTALLCALLELGLWRPLRRRGASGLQLILAAIGLAYVIRYGIQFIAGPDLQSLRANDTTGISFGGGVTIGRTILIASLVSYLILLAVALGLRYSGIGKQMRALADNLNLAETTGLDTKRLILVVWVLGGGLAGLAGALYVLQTGSFDPQFGFSLLLPLFAAILLGGAGSPYGAIIGGVILGLAEEWSTLFIPAQWQLVVGFGVLIAVLVLCPEGVFAPVGRV